MFMEKMHHASNSGVAKAIMAVIAISFVITGMYGYLGATTDTSAVKVNGEEVSQQQFQQQYNDEYQRMSNQLGAEFAAVADTPEFTQGLRTNVLNRLIDQQLLSQYVSDLNLTVSDERIKHEIVKTPMFQIDGKFSNDAYQQVLRNNGMNADMYAQYLREALRLEQLQSGLAETEFLLPKTQADFAQLFFQQRQVRLAHLSLADELKKQTVTEQEVADYYNANKSAFIVPELVKVQYVDLTKAAIEKSVSVTDTEIQQYYQDNKDQFSTQAQQHLAHIQFANEKDALDAYEALQQGEDFAALAKAKSTDKLSGEKGGDLGWLNNGDLPKDFEDAATLVEVGKYSTPIKVDGNYHIVKVEDRKAATVLPLEQVKDKVIAQVRQELLNTQFYTLEKKVAEKAFEDQGSLKSAAAVIGADIQETDYFPRNALPKALNFPVVISAIFDGEISQGNMNSEPMNVGDQHSIVVRVLDHKAQGTKTLDEAKAEITTFLTRQKAEQAVLAQAENAVKALTANGTLPDNVKFGEQETWVYAENKDPALNDVIFAMKAEEGKKAYQAAKTNSGDVVIVALDNIENAKVEEAVRRQFDLQVARNKATDVQVNLLKSLRAKAKIEINEDFMKQQRDE
ncbi:peptidylprolyl isomerase [Lonepinella sp. BR2357]|uniref:peptidylprolyl isomerase n=1 Tax=Lonepinella sp. BR2357 TaxID=3434549 RepID=UPI003F6E04A1